MKKKSYVGVDLHKNNFTACYIRKDVENEFKVYELSQDGLKDFRDTLSRRDKVAVESVSNVSFFCDAVKKHVKSISVVAPGHFQIISKSIKKTDKNDAEALAFYLSKNMLPKARTKEKIYYDLGSLIDTREQLVRSRKNLVNRTHAITIRHGVNIPRRRLIAKNAFSTYVFSEPWDDNVLFELKLIHNQISNITKNIQKLETKITELASTLKGYENIISITGIGELSAALLLSVIGNIDDFKTSGQLASYFGIVPKVSQSNETDKNRRITKKGSKIGRSTLVLCSMVARQKSTYLKEFHERIRDRRGGGKAMIASARKFLVIVFNTLKNDWVFDDFPNYKYHVRTEKETSDSN